MNESERDRLLRADDAYRLRKYAEAAELYEQVLAQDPRSVEASFRLSVIYRLAHKPAEAVEMAGLAVQGDAQAPHAHSQLGLCLLDLGRLDEAATCFRQAIELSPDQVAPYINLGGVLQIQGKNREAVEIYRRALEIGPDWVQILPRLSKSLTADQQYGEAAKVAARIVELSPDDASARVRYGSILETLGLTEEAMRQFAAAMRIDPRQGYACFALVRMSIRPGLNIRPALDSMLKTLEGSDLAKDQRAYLEYAVAKAYENEGNYESSSRHYDEANRVLLGGIPPRIEGAIDESLAFRIKNFDRSFVDRFRSLGSESETPIFVVGMMRSGTTLAEQILTSHPDVGSIGERRFWLDRRSTVLDPPGNVVNPDRLRQAIDDYLSLVEPASVGKQRVVERTPINYAHLAIIHVAFPNARIIHLKRHPLDTCLSIWTTPDAAPAEWGHEKRAIVEEYRAYLRIMDHWRSNLTPDRLLDVSYEELVADQEAVTRRMIEFCGLPWDDKCMRPERNERSVSTPSVWQVRQPVYRSSTARWRKFEPWLGEFRDLLA